MAIAYRMIVIILWIALLAVPPVLGSAEVEVCFRESFVPSLPEVRAQQIMAAEMQPTVYWCLHST